MPIKRRLVKLTKIPIHREGRSVNDPRLRYAPKDPFFDKHPHLQVWPDGSQYIILEGRRNVLVGHILYTDIGYQCWVVTQQVERILSKAFHYPTMVYMPIKRPRLMTLSEAFAIFNSHRDYSYTGLFRTKRDAEDGLVEDYEKRFDTILAA